MPGTVHVRTIYNTDNHHISTTTEISGDPTHDQYPTAVIQYSRKRSATVNVSWAVISCVGGTSSGTLSVVGENTTRTVAVVGAKSITITSMPSDKA